MNKINHCGQPISQLIKIECQFYNFVQYYKMNRARTYKFIVPGK